jgi:hypothetical protein
VAGAATFVGRAVCATCHAAIDAAFSLQAHGKNFHHTPPTGMDLINGFGGACAPCHTTGFGEPSGWQSSATTPQLDSIGCEECHGPGSKHAAKPAKDNIVLTPVSENTCWDCHVPNYKMLRGPVGATTDLMLRNTAPGKIAVHHPQATFLLGKLGYNLDDMPGPHRYVDNTCATCHLNPDPTSIDLAQVGSSSTTVNHGANALRPDLATCAHCHGSDSRAQARFDSFEEEINAALIELGGADPDDPSEPDESASGGLLAAYASAHGIDLNTNADPDNRYVRHYKAARYNFSYVIAGIAVHNPSFAEKLIEDAKAQLSG